MQREVVVVEPADQDRLMVEDFADAILHHRPPRYGSEDAVANMRVLDALRMAAAPAGLIEIPVKGGTKPLSSCTRRYGIVCQGAISGCVKTDDESF
jgi:hypothetical protein